MNKPSLISCFSIDQKKLVASLYDEDLEKNIFSKEFRCEILLDINHLKLNNLNKGIEESILELEKFSGTFLNNIYLMIDTPNTISISLSLFKNNEHKSIEKKDIQYLVQSARQQIASGHPDKNIIHIIINNYKVNDIDYEHLPQDIICKKLSIDVEFICLPKYLVKSFEDLFSNHQISIDKFICTNYAKSFEQSIECSNIREIGIKLGKGLNKQEVVIISKKLEKKGFFEKLFHFFK